jgi:hypothetical protein
VGSVSYLIYPVRDEPLSTIPVDVAYQGVLDLLNDSSETIQKQILRIVQL